MIEEEICCFLNELNKNVIKILGNLKKMKFGKRSLFSVRGLMYMFYVIYIK